MIGQMVQIQSYEKHSTAVEEADTERQKIFSRVLQQGSNRESTITELHLEKKVVVGWKKGKGNQNIAISGKISPDVAMAQAEKQILKLREFLSILKSWSNNDFTFTHDMMQKYKTRTKRRGVYQPANYFLSVGDNNLKQFNSHITYSFDEFIRDAKNPENINIAKPNPVAPVVEVPKPTPNTPKQTVRLEIAETEIVLEQDAPVIDQGNNYYLIGLVGLVVVALFFIMRRRK